jgi:hypothetical protein
MTPDLQDHSRELPEGERAPCQAALPFHNIEQENYVPRYFQARVLQDAPSKLMPGNLNPAVPKF